MTELEAQKQTLLEQIEQAEQMLREQYGIEPDDWMSADIQIVPAIKPLDVGIDRAAFAAYGFDDR